MDLYHIPNDNGKNYRLKKFIEYQHEVPEIHFRFLGEWAKRNKLDKNQILNLAWILSVTYNEITTIILYIMIYIEKKDFKDIWKKYKSILFFGSARKYSKNNDEFLPLMQQWNEITKEKPYIWIKKFEKKKDIETWDSIRKEMKQIKYVGRFSMDLFLELVIYMKKQLEFNIKEPTLLDWKNCSNLTSGIFNIFYEDEKANNYDKNKNLLEEDKIYLTHKLLIIQEEIYKTYPEQDNDITMFIGKICSFRNLFKNARYGGFHHDRELEVIRGYEKNLPKYKQLYKEFYDIRKKIFDQRFLGELHNWTGIRKERKKIWLTTGKTGVEKE